MEESLARTFRVNHGAGFHTSAVEDVPHTFGIIDASIFGEVFQCAASLASTVSILSSSIPVAERGRSTFVFVGHLFTRVTAVVVGIRPDALGVQVTRSRVAVLVRTVPVAEGDRPETHRISLAVSLRVENRATAITTRTKKVPITVRIRITLGLRRIHEDALLRASTFKIDETHVVSFARARDVSPAVGAAALIFIRPHAATFSIASCLGGVSNFTRRSASEFSTIPDTSRFIQASSLIEEVFAGESTLLFGLGAPDAHCVGLTLRLIRIVIAVAFADFTVGIPHTFSISIAHDTVPVITILALEGASRRTTNLPVAVFTKGSADFTTINHWAAFITDGLNRIPHASSILDAETTESVLTLAAFDTSRTRWESGVPEAHGIRATFSFSSCWTSGFVGRARLDTSRSVGVPAAIEIISTRSGSVPTDVTEATLLDALGDVETLPFADG